MFLEKCSERQIQEIYQEFNITEQSLKRDVSYLIEWMEKQPHLPNVKGKKIDFIRKKLILWAYAMSK